MTIQGRSGKVASSPTGRSTSTGAVAGPGMGAIVPAARRCGIMCDMQAQRVSSGSPYEPVIGFSRAVRTGPHVFVSGTAPVMPEGANPPPDPFGQARRCLEIILAALREAGAGPEHVVRTRTYLVRAGDWEEVGRAHGEVFADVRPASTMIVVGALLDPRWLVEMEADAYVG
jgi:enamine deaminase RidA (YjgF/YER057c/UK114 family)